MRPDGRARRGETGQQRQARARAGRQGAFGGHIRRSAVLPAEPTARPSSLCLYPSPPHNWERLGTPLIAVHNTERCSPVPTVGSMDQPPHSPRGSSHRGTLFVTAGVGIIIIIIIIIVVVARPITNRRIISACLPLLPFCSVRDGGCPLTLPNKLLTHRAPGGRFCSPRCPLPFPPSSHAIHLTEYLHATPRFSRCPPPDTRQPPKKSSRGEAQALLSQDR